MFTHDFPTQQKRGLVGAPHRTVGLFLPGFFRISLQCHSLKLHRPSPREGPSRTSSKSGIAHATLSGPLQGSWVRIGTASIQQVS